MCIYIYIYYIYVCIYIYIVYRLHLKGHRPSQFIDRGGILGQGLHFHNEKSWNNIFNDNVLTLPSLSRGKDLQFGCFVHMTLELSMDVTV